MPAGAGSEPVEDGSGMSSSLGTKWGSSTWSGQVLSSLPTFLEGPWEKIPSQQAPPQPGHTKHFTQHHGGPLDGTIALPILQKRKLRL